MVDPLFTVALEALLAALLVVAAVIDARTFTISNRLNLLIAALAIAFWLAAGLAPWPDIAVRLAIATGLFALLALAFAAGMMGGGDVKLAAALGLWFTPAETLRFLVIMSLAGGIVTIAVLVRHRLRRQPGKPRIPYGVAIAAGGLVILAQRFLNQFV